MLFEKMKVYAFVGPSGTGKSYRAQMVASEKGINFIIDDGLMYALAQWKSLCIVQPLRV